MAIRFARQAGNWSNPLTWDDGLTIPTTGDEVYLNNYNITIDQNVTTGFIANSITPIGVPLDPIPDMTSNTSPIGVGQAFAALGPNLDAWKPFRKGINTFSPTTDGWLSTAANVGQVGFQFNSAKNIQRYAWYSNQQSASYRPRNWTFEGSNDSTTWVILHTVTNATNQATYNSPNISNPSSYTYYRINITATQGGFQVILNGLNMTESTSLGNGYLSGGTATVNNNLTITSDFYTGASTSNLFTVPALTPNQVTFIGNAPGTLTGSGTNNPAVINATGTGTINYIGNLRATNRDAMGRGIQLASGTTLNFTGDILGSRNTSAFSQTNAVGIACGAGSTVNMVGSITAAETGLWTRGITTTTNAIVNITGNVDGGVGTDPARTNSGIFLGAGIVTIVGNVYAGPNAIGVEGSGNNSTQVKITGNLYNWTDGSMAAFTRFLFLESADMQWNFKKFNLTNNILYTPGVATGHPATNNVRTGIVYGPTSNLIGTCAVPPAAAVSLGVPVDNTVGTASLDANALAIALTASLTPALDASLSVSLDAALSVSLPPAIAPALDTLLSSSLDTALSASLPPAIAPILWDEDVANLTTPNSIGERVKNCSTVATTGAQIASFNP